jgi:hypothetical protein
MKYIILFAIIYFAYRYFFSNKALNQGSDQSDNNRDGDGGFSDYEELK